MMKIQGNRICALLCAAIACQVPAEAAESGPADLSLEDLLKTEVVTVSRKAESLQSTGAAAFVITRDDIERSGVSSLPEALRMAPGVQVARLADNRWAVTIRGFNGRFADKLQVLVDGRSIYSPLFSGVQWEFEDMMLEDIERIEVIRGPGGSIWGANAVNGVINIITRRARDTQGNLVVAGAGTTERAFGEFRKGGETDDGYYRVWAKGLDTVPSEDLSGQRGNDFWRASRAGFRRDGALGSDQRYSISGEAYAANTGDRWIVPNLDSPTGASLNNVTEAGSGIDIHGKSEWIHEDGTLSTLQSFVDHELINVEGQVHETRTTVDLDYQRQVQLDVRNDLIWGLGYRISADDVTAQGIFNFVPARSTQTLASAFLQDEVALVPNRLRLIGGVRLEHNNYTGYDPLPNVRAVWTPNSNETLWTALSRAVHTPSRAEADAQINYSVIPAQPPYLPLPVLLQDVHSPAIPLESEKVDTLEFGYRQQLGASLSYDAAVFFSHYRKLLSAQTGQQILVAGPVPYIVQQFNPDNAVSASTRGLELSADWRVTPAWHIAPNFTYFFISGSTDSTDPAVQQDASNYRGSSPVQQWSLRSDLSLGSRHQWNLWLRHVGRLDNASGTGTPIASYTTLDTRIAWRAMPGLDLSLVGQNLLQARHQEFLPNALPSVPEVVQRGCYVKLQYHF